MKHSFEYCALRYLIVWEREERELYQRMTNDPSTQDLRQSLKHFSVSRSFKGIADERKATFILHALRSVAHQETLSPCEKVLELADRFEAEFDQYNLSAASKLLWLIFRAPYVICDGRAVSALRAEGCEFNDKDYSKYYEAWHSKYGEHKLEIEQAAERLTKLQPFFGAWHDSENSLRTTTSQPWFRERVFDNYLWELGTPNKLLDASGVSVFRNLIRPAMVK